MPQGKPPPTAGRLPRTLSAFRRLFSPDTQYRAARPTRPTRPVRPRAPQSVETQAAALDTLINAEQPRAAAAAAPAGLRSALSELVGFSRVFSSRRLSRTARDPADCSRPRHPPPHYDRFERPRGRTRRTRMVRNFDADVGTGWVRSVELEKENTTTTDTTTTDTTTTDAPTTTDATTTTDTTTTDTTTTDTTDKTTIAPPSDALNTIHARYNHFLSHTDVQTVVDIGAGTGSWSLYVAYKLRLNVPVSPLVKIIAVDREPLGHMRGVSRVQGDICDGVTQGLVDGALETARIDVVLCDVTLETAGSQMMDAAQSLHVCRRVWEFARWRLRTEDEVGRAGGGVLL